MSHNQLALETSPYLLQHADNPVAWRSWNSSALAEARATGKPILLSIGYAACHWCHVMAHECFEDETIARLMNDLFVNIKVDREERPDLDHIYQSALALMGEQGGWPLTMFLTPAAEPFWGGTYFPPTARYGRPGFPDVLRGIAQVYRRDPEKVQKNVQVLRDAMAKMSTAQPGAGVMLDLLDRVAERLCGEVDPAHGGIGTAPKFPQPSIFELLWRAWLRTRQPHFRQAVMTTLRAMCQGGLYDHLGGGFARYSTDERWLVPHFEKMLYDNAQHVGLLTMVWQETRDPLFATRIAETVGWLLRDMTTPDGGFSSSIDADSDGEEGKFYVWTAPEVASLLVDDAALFSTFYDVTARGNWDGRVILNRRAHVIEPTPTEEAVLARCRRILLEARARRSRPGLDDKVLADWNGLMIATLAHASQVFEQPTWLDAARRAFAFIVTAMLDAGRLRHAWRQGRAAHPASLDDYANMARAALALHEATGDQGYIDRARTWVSVLDAHYWDTEGEGYFYTADDTDDVIARTKTISDTSVPAGNGTILGVLVRLHLLTGDTAYRERAETLVTLFSGELTRNFFPLATFLNNSELLLAPVQIVVVGESNDPAVRSLLQHVHGISLPTAVITSLTDASSLPPSHPAHGKRLVDGKPAAYVCRGQACSLPIVDPAELTEALRAA